MSVKRKVTVPWGSSLTARIYVTRDGCVKRYRAPATRSEKAELLRGCRDRGLRPLLGDGRRGRLWPAAEEPRQALEVRFEHLEHRRRVERGGRVVDRIEDDAAAGDRQRLLLAVHAGDAERTAGEELRREVAERCDYLRLDQLDLAEEVRLARHDLVRLRVAVAGRATLEDVRDVDVLTPELDAREQPFEQL